VDGSAVFIGARIFLRCHYLVADRTANLWLRVLHKTLPPVGYFNHEIELLMKRTHA
jgi:hypothetical protein